MIGKNKNYRVTKQRELVLEELKKVCCHPSARKIFELMKKCDKSVGLATVYRSLDFLEKNGLIIKLETKGKEARYDGNIKKHCHLICKNCGKVFDIFDIQDIKIKSDQLKKSGFEVCTDFLEVHGLCPNCK